MKLWEILTLFEVFVLWGVCSGLDSWPGVLCYVLEEKFSNPCPCGFIHSSLDYKLAVLSKLSGQPHSV